MAGTSISRYCQSPVGLTSAVLVMHHEAARCGKQAAEAAELAQGEELLLPPDLDYSAIQLSGEDREKLGAARYTGQWHHWPKEQLPVLRN